MDVRGAPNRRMLWLSSAVLHEVTIICLPVA